MARTRNGDVVATQAPTTASLLRWSSVFGGVVIGAALLILLTTLWTALALATGVEAIEQGLGWYLAASAIVALFVGGLLAGALSGVPGATPGIFNGLAVWGILLILSAAVGVPGALNAFAMPGLEAPALQADQALWPAFWSLLIGAITAGIGGALGGLMTRGEPMAVGGHAERDDREYREREYRERPPEREYRERPTEREYRERDYPEREYRERPPERDYPPGEERGVDYAGRSGEPTRRRGGSDYDTGR